MCHGEETTHPAVAVLQQALVKNDEEMKNATDQLAAARSRETAAEARIMKLTKEKLALTEALAMVRKRVGHE